MSVRNKKKPGSPPNIFTTGSFLAMGFWGWWGPGPDTFHRQKLFDQISRNSAAPKKLRPCPQSKRYNVLAHIIIGLITIRLSLTSDKPHQGHVTGKTQCTAMMEVSLYRNCHTVPNHLANSSVFRLLKTGNDSDNVTCGGREF